jgi:hypothetical protein
MACCGGFEAASGPATIPAALPTVGGCGCRSATEEGLRNVLGGMISGGAAGRWAVVREHPWWSAAIAVVVVALIVLLVWVVWRAVRGSGLAVWRPSWGAPWRGWNTYRVGLPYRPAAMMAGTSEAMRRLERAGWHLYVSPTCPACRIQAENLRGPGATVASIAASHRNVHVCPGPGCSDIAAYPTWLKRTSDGRLLRVEGAQTAAWIRRMAQFESL